MDILQKITEPFNKLTFEEERHRYYVEGKPLDKSVSA